MSAPTLVDARGMRCPWPVVRLARAMREREAGGAVRIWADDPIASREIAALAAERRWSLAPGPGEAPVDLLVSAALEAEPAD